MKKTEKENPRRPQRNESETHSKEPCTLSSKQHPKTLPNPYPGILVGLAAETEVYLRILLSFF